MINDSADIANDGEVTLADAISEAEKRLRAGLDLLEKRLTPINRDMEKMRKSLEEAESFSEDRAELAQRLDEVSAELNEQTSSSEQIIANKDALINEQQETIDMIVNEFDGQLQSIYTQVAKALGEG